MANVQERLGASEAAPTGEPAVRKRRRSQAPGATRRRQTASKDPSSNVRPADPTALMGNVRAAVVEPVPEFNPSAADAYFCAPIPVESRPSEPNAAEAAAVPRVEVTAADIGLDWLKEHSRQWSYIPPCIEEAFAEADIQITEMCVSAAMSSSSLSDMLKRATKRMGKVARTDGSTEKDDVIKQVTASHAELKRTLEEHRTGMKHIGEALSILVGNYAELVRRTRQSLRTVIVHSRQNATFQPDTPGASLLKDAFVNT